MGAPTSELMMLLKGNDSICVLNDEVRLAKWERVGRTFQAKGTASSNLRRLIKHEIILKPWGNMSDWLEKLEKMTGTKS